MTHSSVDRRILEKLRGLDDTAKQRVLEFVEREARAASGEAADFEDWFGRTEKLLEELRRKYGKDYVVGANDLLDELREESSWPFPSS